MLIEVSVSNFLSFKEKTKFSLVPGKGRNLNHHILLPEDRPDMKALKGALIYGANASGKTNFTRAILFARNVILKGNIDFYYTGRRQPFKLDVSFNQSPSEFSFVFKKDTHVFEYSFRLDDKKILEEKLIEIRKTTENTLFHRTTDETGTVTVAFPDFKFSKKEDEKRIQYIAKDTLPDKLFLYELNTRNISEMENSELFTLPFQWFKLDLIIITPETKLTGLEFKIKENQELSNLFTNILDFFDTGISGMEIQEVDLEKVKEKIPSDLFPRILEDAKTAGRVIIKAPDSIRYAVSYERDSIHAYKLMTRHKSEHTNDVLFELSEESDGTQRLFDLIPGLLAMKNSEKVFWIDELDRSLHPILTRKFIELFFELSVDNSAQLITCTHESILLDQRLLRKDEIYFVEKNPFGESSLYSLEEFNPRYDKDIQKGYLLGRFGAVAAIHNKKLAGWK